MKKTKRIIVWFRQDLRLHDNEALISAIARADEVYPVFVFDERVFSAKMKWGFAKTGVFRAQFIIEAVADLRKSLQALGLDLIIRVGKAEDEIFNLAATLRTSWVYCNREPTHEEAQIQLALEKKLWTVGQEIHYHRGKMLYYTSDLPFPITQTPEVFTQFRKEVEKIVEVREPLCEPDKLKPWSAAVELGQLPTVADFGHSPIIKDSRAVLDFEGGEAAAKKRLNYYFWASESIKTYEETRNGLIGGDYSSKFSPYLAQGCLSPKYIYAELQRYERERGGNKSTYWLFFELLWRDFFRLMGKKHGAKIFTISGMQDKPNKKNNKQKSAHDMAAFELWANGETGQPFVDANMRELKATGFMSNRGRQVVASYLVHNLKANWQLGAAYFESLLIDYDVCSNWGNWNYIAGIGNDPRENRQFNPQTQASRYDPDGAYQRLWDK
jgi:deoxyribodipyrimidine photo-lyase